MVDINDIAEHPHVRMQLGLNDTALTRALEEGDYFTAEKMIVENTDPEYLDEGPFDRIPLAILLCRDRETRQHPCNLFLVKILVEGGADPNLRIPEAELQNSSPSPMELLVDLYNDTLNLCALIEESDIQEKSEEYGNILDTIGLHYEEGLSPIELKEQILLLLDTFLAFGGNPNVFTTTSLCTLYHTVMMRPEPDMNLVVKLCQAGADLNRWNVHRTTALMDLILYAELDAAMDVLSVITEINPSMSSLEMKNCCDETALWRAMLSGSPRVAIKLLEKGAIPVNCASITIGNWQEPTSSVYPYGVEMVAYGISALFAPLLGNSSPYLRFGTVSTSPHDALWKCQTYTFDINLLNKVVSSTISPVIDSTSFFDHLPNSVQFEIRKIIERERKFEVSELETLGITFQDIAIPLFGKLKAGLQQLCVRQILHQILLAEKSCEILGVSNTVKVSTKESNTNDQEMNFSDVANGEDKNSVEEDLTDFDMKVSQWELVKQLTPSTIQSLVTEHLKLPPVMIKAFLIEATRLQVGACLYILQTVDCLRCCDGESGDNSIDSDFVQESEGEDDDISSWLSESSKYELDSDEDWATQAYVGLSALMSQNRSDMLNMDVSSSTDSSNEMSSDKEDDYGCLKDMEKNASLCEDEQNGYKEKVDAVKETDSTSNDSSSSSGESVPKDICRDEYEKFSDVFCSDVSPIGEAETDNTESCKNL